MPCFLSFFIPLSGYRWSIQVRNLQRVCEQAGATGGKALSLDPVKDLGLNRLDNRLVLAGGWFCQGTALRDYEAVITPR
jgi:hypothetical protein